MKKRISAIGVITAFMLLAISFASAVNTNETNYEDKESPLYRIRTRQAITERMGNMLENIKIKFLGERVFFIPSNWLTQEDLRMPLAKGYTGLPMFTLCQRYICTIMLGVC